VHKLAVTASAFSLCGVAVAGVGLISAFRIQEEEQKDREN
jgi:hypothetical protein